MQLVSGRYDYNVTCNCNFSVQNDHSCQKVCIFNSFQLNYDKFKQNLTEIAAFYLAYFYSIVAKLYTIERFQ